jgi:homoserine kinase
MAVTDDTIVAKFLQVKLREQFPKCDTHILTCDTEGAQIEYL